MAWIISKLKVVSFKAAEKNNALTQQYFIKAHPIFYTKQIDKCHAFKLSRNYFKVCQ